MKPDGVTTTPAEPMEALEAEPEVEAAANEEQPQQDQSPSPPQPAEPENMNKATDSTAAPPDEEANGRMPDPKNKTKAPVKTRPGPSGTKAAATTGAASRPGAAQNRVANSVARMPANGVAKRPAQPELKKAPPAGAAGQVKKGPPAAAVVQRTQVKAAERKPVGTTRPAVGSANSRPRPATNASSTLSKKPASSANSAAAKPKTTAPRPATAPAAKPSVSASFKAAPVPKTTRPVTAPVPRSTISTAPIKPTTTTTKPVASRSAASVPSTARSASSQPSKVSATSTAVKKDVGKTSTSAAARKPVAPSSNTTTRPTAAKTSKPEATKPATAAKQLSADTKTTQTKHDESKPVPTRKVPPSPRNTPSRSASSRMATASQSPKQEGSSTTVSLKRQTTKPTQSVLPLVITKKPTEEPAAEPVQTSSALVAAASAATTAAVATTAVMAAAEFVPEVQAPSEVQLEEHLDQHITAPTQIQGDEAVKLPALEPLNVETIPTMPVVDHEPVGVQQLVAESPIFAVLIPPSIPVGQEACKSDEDYIPDMILPSQEVLPPEPVTTLPFELPVAASVPLKGIDAAEKSEQMIHNDEDEEEEKEGSQQVSVSDMSGTQPTEESRPDSAGLAGSVWRAGGLPSELDSEDVSCSQQGASELSAPGVFEGTESIDDLGDASLKGADGEGASAGSPDFEKVPDIPANEDDDEEDDDDYDYDRVCDMEVGSERAEDIHRQCHDNEEEDEDVEMASEGITESGLESYGNADEDDLAEDYRLDNLNRMQAPPIVPSAPPAAQWGQANPFADPWVQSLQPDPVLLSCPTSNPWQPDSDIPTQAPAQAWLDEGNAEGGPSSPQPPAFMEPIPSSPQHAAEMDASLKPGLVPNPQNMSHSSTLSGPELLAHSCSDASTPEELKDYNINPGVENQQQQPVLVNPAPVNLPDIMRDLDVCLEHGDEELETLPADDVLGGLGTAPTSAPSSSSATREASDTEGEMQISEPSAEPVATAHECFSSTQVAQSISVLQEREETCVEIDGGGGSDTPQSATSAASYGFDCTSNSNAQSTTESCTKSPGIFSLENEEQLPDEAKDPSLIKELTLTPTDASGDVDLLKFGQQGEHQPNSEQQYMLCGKASEEMPESCSLGADVPTEKGLAKTSSENQDDDWDRNAQHPYYSTICEKTDSSLAGRNICFLRPQEMPTIDPTVLPKPHLRPCVDHVTHLPHLPVNLPPRAPSTGPNAQLRRLERHQQQLWEIERRHERQNRPAERGEEEEVGNTAEKEEQERKVKERELENQRRELLLLQQQELKQRQQIIQWQQELEQQNKHLNKQHKTMTTVALSPSGLGTIYEALEPSEAEDFQDDRKVAEMGLKEKVEMAECEHSSQDYGSNMETESSPPNNNASPQSDSATPSPEPHQDKAQLSPPAALNQPPLSPSHPPQWPCPPELDWGKKVDIVQQLINQTLLLTGDGCPPLLLTSAGGTLSPLETSLWPDLLPPITPPSAKVTCVSSFSPEASSSSPQGEWTVVEVETHH